MSTQVTEAVVETVETVETVEAKAPVIPTASRGKEFLFGGVSTRDGITKLRFATFDRTPILTSEGHIDIRFMRADQPMTRPEIARLMQTHELFQDELSQKLLAEYITKGEKPVKAAGTGRRGRKPKLSGSDEQALAQAAAKAASSSTSIDEETLELSGEELALAQARAKAEQVELA